MEVWKKIEEFEDYEVSNLGRVKSTKYNKEKILKSYDSLGYLKIDLSVNGIKKKIKVHQLVAMAFLNQKPYCKLVEKLYPHEKTYLELQEKQK